MRVLGIDYGDSRIGIAISDPFGWAAQGLETIMATGGLKKAILAIIDICNRNDIKDVVIGYPKNMDGSSGFRVDKTEEFIAKLTEAIPEINVIRWDERLTSVAASRTMRELGMKSTQKGSVDKLAAVFILQGYLDRQYNKK